MSATAASLEALPRTLFASRSLARPSLSAFSEMSSYRVAKPGGKGLLITPHTPSEGLLLRTLGATYGAYHLEPNYEHSDGTCIEFGLLRRTNCSTVNRKPVSPAMEETMAPVRLPHEHLRTFYDYVTHNVTYNV